jgi:uncharacterized protein (DUF1800 family)
VSTLTQKNDSQSAWALYEPTDADPWNLARAVHLHRRAAFGAPWARLQQDLADGPQKAIERLLRVTPPAASSTDPEAAAGQTPNFENTPFELTARSIGDAATASGNPERLKAWWLYRMLVSPDPLAERLTLMWHNHFATSNRKVRNLVLMREQNDRLRAGARSPFGELLVSVVKHPAMLVWLDAPSNRRGHPNENLARETMELFTLGIGNYTEDDVRKAARALTGWSISADRFEMNEKEHDDGEKTVLGERGTLTGDDFLRIVLQHPATPRRVAWRLCQTFFGEGVVDDAALAELAEGLRAHELNIGWAVETILRSKLFFAPANLRSRVAGPVQWVVGTLRALELTDPPASTLLLAEWVARMGEDLFYPPNVGGWSEGRSWLSSRSIVARANFADALITGQLWSPSNLPPLEELPGRHVKGVELEGAVAWLAGLLWGEAPAPVVGEIVAAAKSAAHPRPISTAVLQLLSRSESQLC